MPLTHSAPIVRSGFGALHVLPSPNSGHDSIPLRKDLIMNFSALVIPITELVKINQQYTTAEHLQPALAACLGEIGSSVHTCSAQLRMLERVGTQQHVLSVTCHPAAAHVSSSWRMSLSRLSRRILVCTGMPSPHGVTTSTRSGYPYQTMIVLLQIHIQIQI